MELYALEPPGTQQRNESRRRFVRIRTDVPFKEAKREIVEPFERAYLIELLEAHGMNLSACSRTSGLSRKHLRQLMRKYGLMTERRLVEM